MQGEEWKSESEKIKKALRLEKKKEKLQCKGYVPSFSVDNEKRG